VTERPLWKILIATLGQRGPRLRRLLDGLLPQLDAYAGQVRVTALWNNGERSLGEIRQGLVEHADAEYISFIDDDDTVPNFFVGRVMNALATRPDQVGWQMQCWQDGQRLKPTYHSKRFRGWFNDDTGYYRDVSHLNPVKHDIALRCDFRRGEPPEDVSWVTQARELINTEVYINAVMYDYHASSSDSTWRGDVQPGTYDRLVVDHPYFSYHPWSFTQCASS
jgi:hypothetical protein